MKLPHIIRSNRLLLGSTPQVAKSWADSMRSRLFDCTASWKARPAASAEALRWDATHTARAVANTRSSLVLLDSRLWSQLRLRINDDHQVLSARYSAADPAHEDTPPALPQAPTTTKALTKVTCMGVSRNALRGDFDSLFGLGSQSQQGGVPQGEGGADAPQASATHPQSELHCFSCALVVCAVPVRAP